MRPQQWFENQMFLVGNLDVRYERKKSRILHEGVGLSIRVGRVVSTEVGSRAGRRVIGMKLEIPTKCPGEGVRWPVVHTQPELQARC